MSAGPFRKLSISALIALLHLPLIYHASSLYRVLQPGQGIADLAASSLATLLLLFILPYVVLRIAHVPWNPERARMNEYDS